MYPEEEGSWGHGDSNEQSRSEDEEDEEEQGDDDGEDEEEDEDDDSDANEDGANGSCPASAPLRGLGGTPGILYSLPSPGQATGGRDRDAAHV